MGDRRANSGRPGVRVLLAAVATAAASLTVLAPTAGAEDATPRTTAVEVGLPAAGTEDVGAMDESGTSGGIRVAAVGSGGYVGSVNATVSSLSPYLSFHGFYVLFGPDYRYTSETRSWGTSTAFVRNVGRSYANGQLHCAEGWKSNGDGTFSLLGRPCVDNPI
ncbi:hypothetical protein [Saccharothrix sp. Mg75]|uniref:hypothetical protein n=1 Tax=Saccharothrix sp. Mg75 TaxID=3445357 RepID=UPI003EEE98DC